MSPEELLNTPGLQYIQFPKLIFPPTRPFVAYAVEAWPGYVDTHTRNITTPLETRELLVAAGWTQEDVRHWWRLYPPHGPSEPVQVSHSTDDLRWFNLHALALIVTTDYPNMNSRVNKAIDLVQHDRITANHRPHTYHIKSIDTPERTYRVNIPPDNRKNWTCMRIQDPDNGHTHLNCPDIAHRAPFLKHGKRCKHMIAAWMYAELRKKRDTSKTCDSEVSPTSQPQLGSPHATDSTTTPPETQPRRLVSRYADGRPARYSDGTIVRYTAGGTAVELPQGTW